MLRTPEIRQVFGPAKLPIPSG